MSFRSIYSRLSNLLVSLVVIIGLATPLAYQVGQASAYSNPNIYSQTVLHIKLIDNIGLSTSRQSFIGSTNNIAGRLNNILNVVGQVNSVSKLDNIVGNNDASSSISAALNNYYTISYTSNVDMTTVINNLNKSGLVSEAYPQVKPAPAPTSPNYTNLQDYLTAAPTGINSNYADTVSGGNGSNVKIVDIEYSWNTAHEDLAKAATALIPYGTPYDPFNDAQHGTAVLGELEATNNNFGVTGAAYGAQLALVNADSNEYGYDPVDALATAASITQPGDVIQIEQQTYGPNSSYVPIEWIPEVYDAIKALTNSGRVVVEPAGNGNQNLDDSSLYGSTFPMGKPDSGAIIVGAGENCGDSIYWHSRLSFSDYGSRVNLQGPGNCVVTTGYGDLYNTAGINAYYTQVFSGTSSATPVVTAAAADISSAYKTLINGSYSVLSPAQIRSTLEQYSTPQNTTTSGVLTGNIGGQPDLLKALNSLNNPTTPGTPTTTNPTNNTKPTWRWTASTAKAGLATIPYTVDWSKSSSFSTAVNRSTSTTASFTQPTPLTPGTWYFRVRANDSNGTYSNFSATGTVFIDTTPPSTPQNFSAVQSSLKPPKVTLKWLASSGKIKIASYRIYRNGALYKVLSADSRSFVETSGLIKRHTYKYLIKAVDIAGNVSASSVLKTVTIR